MKQLICSTIRKIIHRLPEDTPYIEILNKTMAANKAGVNELTDYKVKFVPDYDWNQHKLYSDFDFDKLKVPEFIKGNKLANMYYDLHNTITDSTDEVVDLIVFGYNQALRIDKKCREYEKNRSRRSMI